MNIGRFMALVTLKCLGVATAVCVYCSHIVSGSCNRDREVTYLLCRKGLRRNIKAKFYILNAYLAGEKHIRESHIPDESPFKCLICQYSDNAALYLYDDAETLVKHLTSHVALVSRFLMSHKNHKHKGLFT